MIPGDAWRPCVSWHPTTKLKRQIFPFLRNADARTSTGSEPHRASPDTRRLRLTYEGPKVEVLPLSNKVLVHVQFTLVHKLGGSLVQIVNNGVYIHVRQLIRAILPYQSPALSFLG